MEPPELRSLHGLERSGRPVSINNESVNEHPQEPRNEPPSPCFVHFGVQLSHVFSLPEVVTSQSYGGLTGLFCLPRPRSQR